MAGGGSSSGFRSDGLDGMGSMRTRVVTVAGRKYSVRSSATDERLLELAEEVEARALEASGGKGLTMDAVALAALAFAAEAREQRVRADRLAQFAGEALRELLVRVQEVLGESEGGSCDVLDGGGFKECGDNDSDEGACDGELIEGDDADCKGFPDDTV